MEEELKHLKPYLPRGSFKIVAERTGHSRDYVSKVFRGEKYNERVIVEIRKIADRHYQLKESLKKFAS